MGSILMMYFCFFGSLFSQVCTTELLRPEQLPMLIQVRRDVTVVDEPEAEVTTDGQADFVSVLLETDKQKAANGTGIKASAPVATQPPALALASSRTTASAFSQISELDAEFKGLHDDDNSHIRQLLFNIQLRDQLRGKLHDVDEQLKRDNMDLAARTQNIQGNNANPVANTQPNGNADAVSAVAPDATSAQGQMVEQAMVLLQKTSNQDIAAEALDRVKALVNDLTALRQRDNEEVQALSANAKSRETLGKEIAFRKEQLSHDGGDLLLDLGKIRDLVQGQQGQDGQAQPGTVSALSQQGQELQMQGQEAPVDPTQLVSLAQQMQQGQGQTGTTLAVDPSQTAVDPSQMAADPGQMPGVAQQLVPHPATVMDGRF